MEFNNTNYDLTFIHINDIHGRINGENDGIDISKFFTFLKKLREDKKNGRVFLIDSGDTLHGTSFANLSKGESIVEVFNLLGFDYTTLGNHDFNYGYEHLKKLLVLQNYKTLALNLIDNDNSNLLSYDIIEVNGFNVCFFGIITPETYYKTSFKNIKDLTIINPEEAFIQLSNKLKDKKIDFYVGITHLGLDKSTQEIYKSSNLAEKFPEINILFDGHSHTEIKENYFINKTLISQTGNYNKKVALTQVKLREKKNNHEFFYRLFDKNDFEVYESDFKIQNKIRTIQNSQESITKTIIGKSSIFLAGDRELVRKTETNLTQLITDAILWKTKCDVVLINGGSIRDSIAKGNVTIGDIVNSLPFGNCIVTKKIKGNDLKVALENGLKAYPESLGAMAQVSGMEVFFNPNNPPFKKINNIYINKNPFSLDFDYCVAMTDFMALGGEEYTSLVYGDEINHYSTVEDIVIEYIKKFGINTTNHIIPRLIAKAN
ncbi:bifunctional metallophosphatase/5'-nucleotidase (plasmid) [Cetobacterium somerae]|uniref:bifunctional metallophosphatase/5'-nucleotidase n=1 Tax=Cetobacterium somerae TaxID=188913 RepID=UPI003D768A19